MKKLKINNKCKKRKNNNLIYTHYLSIYIFKTKSVLKRLVGWEDVWLRRLEGVDLHEKIKIWILQYNIFLM